MNKTMLAGAIGAGGLVFQILLGEGLGASANPKGSELLFPHMVIGVGGIALVAFLTSSIFFMPSSFIARGVLALALLLTFAQVSLGFMLLFNPQQMLIMTHQGIAVVILVLLLLGGILASRARKAMAASTPAKM
jgi:hypothetical protein